MSSTPAICYIKATITMTVFLEIAKGNVMSFTTSETFNFRRTISDEMRTF